jgi:hypothetical protein
MVAVVSVAEKRCYGKGKQRLFSGGVESGSRQDLFRKGLFGEFFLKFFFQILSLKISDLTPCTKFISAKHTDGKAIKPDQRRFNS